MSMFMFPVTALEILENYELLSCFTIVPSIRSHVHLMSTIA